jgi:UDP-N-acetylglucosamine--N-acetylmuramyl-(pentapeptide) pyrophosphoryl-undecaprenol N-acetylglucosamine transferase
MVENKKILLVGGGTGGHVTPLLAVIEKLLEMGKNADSIHFVTDRESAKMDYVLGHRINVYSISGGKFHRFFTLANIITPFLVLAGFLQSLSLLIKIKPKVVLAKGAYLSLPFVCAAWLLRVPVYLHESDSIMGVTNQRLSVIAKKIFVTFPKDYYSTDLKDKIIYSGLPIRKRFFRKIKERNFPSNSRIMIWGGSQGAEKLNELMLLSLKDYLARFELYHICGPEKFASCQKAKDDLTGELKNRYHLFGFLGREIEKIIQSVDLVVSRAGATSLFELAVLAKPTIVIPYPYAAANHQEKNAQYFAAKGAVVFLKEGQLDSKKLKRVIFDLMSKPEERLRLSHSIKNLSSHNAAEIIAERLLKS